MDYSIILRPVIDTLTWLLPAMLLIGLLKSPWAKGHIGELLVRLFAHWQLDKQTYRRLHNVTLNTPDGTTQIDHVFLSPYGIFVLETKNMSGWIFGSEKQAQWTQKLYKRTFKFQNPLRQNYKHLKALEATLGVNPEHLHSVITFVGGSTFKTEVPANVTQGIGFIRYIKSFQQPLFSEAEVDAMLHALQTAIAQDTAAGLQPFMVVGCAGTVDTGAVDDLSALAALARTQGLWFHVDAAYGALAMLSPAQRPLVQAAAELAEEWPSDEMPFPALVFVTAYDQYAVQAFERQAVDYLLKPVTPERLRERGVR